MGFIMSEKKAFKKHYENKLQELQIELVRLQDWVIDKGKKVAIIFEGRDAAGKGGVIKRITEHLNPRYCKIVVQKLTERKVTMVLSKICYLLPAQEKLLLIEVGIMSWSLTCNGFLFRKTVYTYKPVG